MSFESFGLDPAILRAVKEKNYVEPTPIQAQAIPVVLEGKDLIGCAQTGTGKTAGFTLPVLHRLHQEKSHSLRALVLVPTRELAAQVYESIRTYGRYLPLRSAVVIGGVGFDPQRMALRRGVDILVATPGRLLDHMRQRNVSFEHLQVLIIDEADRMLDMGFIPDIRTIIRSLPAVRQTLFFSATMPEEIRGLANEILKNPLFIQVTPQGTPAEGVRQVAYLVESGRKKDLLLHLVEKDGMDQVLVFTRTRRRADDLVSRLKRNGRTVEALHSDKSQTARTRALEAFRNGKVQILVATNIAARGLDIKGVSHVINYEIPDSPEDYVHRIGRTARAQATGDAIALVSPEEVRSFKDIERLIGTEIPRETVPGFECRVPVILPSNKRTFRPRRFGSVRGRGSAMSRVR